MLYSHPCLIFLTLITTIIGLYQGYFAHPENYYFLDFFNAIWDFPGPNDKGALTVLVFLLSPIIFLIDIILTIITNILLII